MPARGSRTARVLTSYRVEMGDRPTVAIVARTHVGAVYIDLCFRGDATPFEVINVYDYAAGRSLIDVDTNVRGVLLDWIAENDLDELTSSDKDEWEDRARHPRREWLKKYVENSWNS